MFCEFENNVYFFSIKTLITMYKQTILQLTKSNQNDMIKMSQTIDITLQPMQ